MKQKLLSLFVAALVCSAMMFAQEPEVINTWVNDELAVDQEWVSGTAYPTFDFDEYISCGTTGGDNGAFYETNTTIGDWRVYRARGEGEGKFWLAAKGAKINRVSFTYYGASVARGGGLLSKVPGTGLTDSIASDSVLVFETPVDSVILYVGTSNSEAVGQKISAQLRIQRFFIEYTIDGDVDRFTDKTSGLKFEITSIGATNTVKVIGNSYTGTSYTIPASVTYNEVNFTVTEIGERAFSGCSGLTSITIPNSVTAIGRYAFEGCSSLPIENNLRYADTYLVEAVDKTLSTYTIKEGTKWIGSYAFNDCVNLTSIFIPNSVKTIERYSFPNCLEGLSVYYGGSLDDWCMANLGQLSTLPCPGAYCPQPEYFNYDLFINKQKVSILNVPNTCSTIKDYAFLGCNLDSIVFPNTLQKIGNFAFYGCNNVKSLYIPISVTQIGQGTFRNLQIDTAYIANPFVSYQTLDNTESYFITFNTSTHIKITSNCFVENIKSEICGASINMNISPSLFAYYDEIGLSDYNYTSSYSNYYAADENGYVNFTKLRINSKKTYYLYAKKGTEYIYKDEIEVSTKSPTVSCSSSTTQTTITLSNITADTDESVQTLTKGIYYNGQRYEADENNSVVLRNIAPNKKCTLQVYGCYNGTYYDGDKKYITTKSIDPKITISQVTPTTAYAYGTYTQGDATILGTSLNCKTTSTTLQGDEGFISGLKPNATYTFEYSVNTKEGGMYSITKQVTTQALTLTTLTPKIVSAGTAVVAAETNISDYETNVGFEWRKYDAPSSMPSKSGTAILYNGMMEGKLLNLGTDAYWNVRPYYEAADGTRYYGEWITFDPSDFSYFEPTVHTYALATSPTSNAVQVRGYVMTGTDDVTEQGFEYWFNSDKKAPNRAPAATADSVYRVTAAGQVMTAVLEDLAYSTTYTCRAYAIAGGKTYYGEEVQFLTPEDPRPIYTLTVIAGENGSVNIEVSGQYREGEQVTLIATPNVGYQFEQWSDGSTENPYIFTIMQNIEITATFKQSESGLTDLRSGIMATKYLHNGQLIIDRNGQHYSAMGERIR